MSAAGLTVAVLAVLAALASSHLLRERSDYQRHMPAALEEQLWRSRHGAAAQYAPPHYFTQDQDHFDGTNTNTWQQAYYVNATFWKPGSSAPVFLCVGGEGPPLDGSVVSHSVHCNVAVEYLQSTGAIMFAVEHRYYGCHNASACPVTDLSSNSALKYLSSRQALGDLATFVEYATAAYQLTSANKWVSFGGSYPGMLASFFRLKFPNLVHASIASSAPVEARLDMQGYNDVTAAAYSVSDNGVGGSPACTAAIRTGHATIGTLFTTSSGRSQLAKLFGQTPSWYEDRGNQASFAGEGVAYFVAQGNDPTCTQAACNIKLICQIMVNTTLGTEVERLAVVRSEQYGWLSPAVDAVPSNELDYWGWQTCTEFGFYQTCEVGTQCMFTQGLSTLQDNMEFCTSDFGVPADKVSKNINYTNAWYGGWDPSGTCILYPNGEVDPWHSLSVLKPPSPGLEVLWVPGASHHAWTHPSSADDQASVVSARKSIRATIQTFLTQPCE